MSLIRLRLAGRFRESGFPLGDEDAVHEVNFGRARPRLPDA